MWFEHIYMYVFKYADERRIMVNRIHPGFPKPERLALSYRTFLIFSCSTEQYFGGSAFRLHNVILVRRNNAVFGNTRGNV